MYDDDYQLIISKLVFQDDGNGNNYSLDSLVRALTLNGEVRDDLSKIKTAISILDGLGYNVIFRYQGPVLNEKS